MTCGFSYYDSGRYPSIFDVMRDRCGITGVRNATTTLASVHASSASITPLPTPKPGRRFTIRPRYPYLRMNLNTTIHASALGLVVARRHGQLRRAGVPLNRLAGCRLWRTEVDLAGCVGQCPPYMHGTVHVVPAERQHFLASEPEPGWTATSHGTSPWTASRIPMAFGAPITSNVGLSPTGRFTSCAEAAHRPARLAELDDHRKEARARALTEQARSGLGMNELPVAAPGAGVRETLVESKRVNGGETGFFHGALTVGRACHSGIDTWGHSSQSKDLSCLGHSGRYPPGGLRWVPSLTTNRQGPNP